MKRVNFGSLAATRDALADQRRSIDDVLDEARREAALAAGEAIREARASKDANRITVAIGAVGKAFELNGYAKGGQSQAAAQTIITIQEAPLDADDGAKSAPDQAVQAANAGSARVH